MADLAPHGPSVLNHRQISEIIGRWSVDKTRSVDVSMLLEHIHLLEEFLDRHDEDDVFGTEGWRHSLGIESPL